MKAERLIGWGSLVLLAVMPFHAFLATWGTHLVGYETAWHGWKEALIGLMLIAAAGVAVKKPSKLLTPLNFAIGAYGLLTIVFALTTGHNGQLAEIFSIKANLGFLAVYLAASTVKDKRFKRLGQRILLGASGIVSAFTIVQATILAPDFLEWFGYGPATIPVNLPYGGLMRFPSTLGGPNQLGAFLILPIALTLKLLLRQRRNWQFLLLAVQSSALVLTFSRSAWLGALAAIAIVVWLEAPKSWRLRISLAGLGIITVAAVAIVNSSNSQLLVRGGLNPGTSDAERVASLEKGAAKVFDRPLGLGPGAAGPASFYNRPLITENYYLQIAAEVGLMGLGLYLTTQVLWVKKLWPWRYLPGLAGPLLASLAGIAIVNLFLHGWADSSTALTYWVLAGLTAGGAKDV